MHFSCISKSWACDFKFDTMFNISVGYRYSEKDLQNGDEIT